MAEEWVSLWVQCLKGNLDYAEYCEARKAGDQLKCAELEGQFERIAGIYEDFGAIDHWPEDGMGMSLEHSLKKSCDPASSKTVACTSRMTTSSGSWSKLLT
jgi:hypothetical protein